MPHASTPSRISVLLTLLVASTGCPTEPTDPPIDPVDADGDGHNADVDCDDGNPAINPGAAELCNDIDDDCDGLVDDGLAVETYYADTDGDGFGDAAAGQASCDPIEGRVTDATDCDDTSAEVYPGATEVCNRVDDDCDGVADEDLGDTSYWPDADGDGYGDSTAPNEVACFQPDGYTDNRLDCDDDNASVNPGAEETCDGLDEDCDGSVDEGFPFDVYYEDADGDGFGNVDSATPSCLELDGTTLIGGDCNDEDIAVNPDATEVCDGIDNNCDGLLDASEVACGPLIETTDGVASLDTLFGSNGFRVDGALETEGLGGHVAVLGDINGDGFEDFALGRNGSEPIGPFGGAMGLPRVVLGRAADGPPVVSLATADGSGAFSIATPPSSPYSSSSPSAMAAGDINGDGYDDILIASAGSYGAEPAGFVLFGKETFDALESLEGLDGSAGFAIQLFPGWGRSSFTATDLDVNGDGFDDMLVTTRTPGTAGPYSGYTYGSSVVFGGPGPFPDVVDPSALAAGEGVVLTNSIPTPYSSPSNHTAVGDVNGDGYDDFCVASVARSYDGTPSQAYIVFGGASMPPTMDLAALSSLQGFAVSNVHTDFVTGAAQEIGDFNGDGFDDIGFSAGTSYDYKYGPEPEPPLPPPVGGEADEDPGEEPETRGFPGGAVGGDGVILFGGPGVPAVLDLEEVSAPDGARIAGAGADDPWGGSVRTFRALGDINGDGFGDVALGMFSGYGGVGSSHVVLGGDEGGTIEVGAGDGTAMAVTLADVPYGSASIDGAGDVNGDGYDDVLLAAPGLGSTYDGYGLGPGGVVVLFGGANPLPPTVETSAVPASLGITLLGEDISSAGQGLAVADVSGDGFPDLLVGAPRFGADSSTGPYGYRGSAPGAVFVVFGGDFTDSIDLAGTSEDDTLTGAEADEVLFGGAGADILDGSTGSDAMCGGTGDDVLVFDAEDSRRVDGGAGFDTLAVSGDGYVLDLPLFNATANYRGILGIELVDMTAGGASSLVIDRIDLLALAGSSRILQVTGDAEDAVSGTGWTEVGPSDDGLYVLYTSGAATLAVEQELDRSGL